MGKRRTKNPDNSGYLMNTQARDEYGLSRDMMTKLMRSGRLPYKTDPLDARVKWIKRGDLEGILQRSGIYRRRRDGQSLPPAS